MATAMARAIGDPWRKGLPFWGGADAAGMMQFGLGLGLGLGLERAPPMAGANEAKADFALAGPLFRQGRHEQEQQQEQQQQQQRQRAIRLGT
jgi:hypothetical protein